MATASDPPSKREILYPLLQLTKEWQLKSACSRNSPVWTLHADKPTKVAKLHGVLTSLSPMLSGKYFEGRIADDTSSIRIVEIQVEITVS